jgi:hypothetical protein
LALDFDDLDATAASAADALAADLAALVEADDVASAPSDCEQTVGMLIHN